MGNRGRQKQVAGHLRRHAEIVRVYGRPSWLSGLPVAIGMPVKFVLWAALLLLAIASAPALLYFAFVAPLGKTGKEGGAHPIVFGGLLLMLFCMCIAAGASLLGVPREGRFCMTPSRYAGLSCMTYEGSPVVFCASVAVFWVIFWACSAGVVSGLRLLAWSREDEAS